MSRPRGSRSPFRLELLWVLILGGGMVLVPLAIPWFAGRAGDPPGELEPASAPEAIERVLTILAAHPSGTDRERVALAGELARRLVSLPAAALRLFADACCAQAGADPRPYTRFQRDALALALACNRDLGLVKHLESLIGPGIASSSKREALQALEAIGRTQDLDLAVALADSPEPEPLLGSLESTCRAILEREPEGPSLLRQRWNKAREPLRAPLLRALGGCGRPDAPQLLAELLGNDVDSDAVILGELARLGAQADLGLQRSARVSIGSYLKRVAPVLRRTATLVCGSLGDDGPVPELIELLRDEDAGVRLAALQSLQRLTGSKLAFSVDAWRAWYEQELAWFRERADAVYELLDSDAPPDVVAALIEIGGRHLHRGRLAQELEDVLEHASVEVRCMACTCLGRLEVRQVYEPLLEALEDPEERVRTAATDALRRLTGHALPPDPGAWRTALSLHVRKGARRTGERVR